MQGNRLVDANGNIVQLRGANTSGLEFVAIQGWSASNPWGTTAPNWAAMKAWKMNAVRIPLNEASWLGYACNDIGSTTTRLADPGNNYKATVKSAVDAATAQGMYVILDLHWTAPLKICPNGQIASADADNSIAFWSSIAAAYKGYPNVIFELFNEPFVTQENHYPQSGDYTTYLKRAWNYLMKGAGGQDFTGLGTSTNSGDWVDLSFTWKIASMQSMIDAVRATGATNVVLVGGMIYDQNFDYWLDYVPIDPLNQLAAAWHPYPQGNNQPLDYINTYADIQAILASGYPVVITEFGDDCYDGLTTAPTVTNVLNFADSNAISVVGWGWNTWYSGGSYCEFILIKDTAGTPTDGYGKVFHDWIYNHL